jgi:hypothetical protein
MQITQAIDEAEAAHAAETTELWKRCGQPASRTATWADGVFDGKADRARNDPPAVPAGAANAAYNRGYWRGYWG